MVYEKLLCPYCKSHKVIRYGKNTTGKQRLMCQNSECSHKTFQLEYSNNGSNPETKEKIKEVLIMSENEKVKNETVEKGRPQRSTAKKPTVKGRWIACVLYPDNCHQMEVLGYLEDIGQTMLYITHQPEDDEKKEHIHVMIHFDYPRTASGFCSAFGTGRFIKSGDLYEPVSDDVDCTGKPVVQLPILSHAEIVSSPADYFRYVLHQDFKSIKSGKKNYQISDITFCGNENELRKLAYQEYQQFNNLIDDLMNYTGCAETARDLMHILIDNNRYDLISYIQGHSYFIKGFFLRTDIKPKEEGSVNN